MKKIIFLVLLVVGCFINLMAQRVHLKDAIERGLISARITGNELGHTGKCASVQIQNLSGSPVTIFLEAGRILNSKGEWDTAQDLLLTETQEIIVQAYQTKQTRLYAMCSQASKGSPSQDVEYEIQNLANKDLLLLAELIEKNKYQTYIGQEAVWCLTDNKDVFGILSYGETEETSVLSQYVAKVKNIDLVKEKEKRKSEEAMRITNPPIRHTKTIIRRTIIHRDTLTRKLPEDKPIKLKEIKVVVSHRFQQPAIVRIAIFDEKGKEIAQVFKSEDAVMGNFNFKYTYTDWFLGNGVYYTRLFANNQLIKEEKTELKE